MKITAHVNFGGLAEELHAMGDRATHLAPAVRKVNQRLEASERRRWSAHPWPGRADGKPAGVKTGALMRSLTDPRAPGAVREAKNDRGAFGSSLPQAGLMQGGTSRQPARRVLELDTADEHAMAGLLADHIVK